MGLGQVGLYLMAVVTPGFYVRRFIGQHTWRLMHVLSFIVFALVLAHELLSGASLSGLTLNRVPVTRRARRT